MSDSPKDDPKTVTRWCMGLPFIAVRTMDREDLDQCAAQLRRIELRLKRQTWLLKAFGAVAFLTAAQYAARIYRAGDGDTGFHVFSAAMAICLGIGGLAGSSGEIIFGRGVLRWLFASALAGLVVSFSFDGAWTEILGSISAIPAFVGGNAMLIRQIVELRRTRVLAGKLSNDINHGEAWYFEREFKVPENSHPERHTLQVLPKSGIAVKVDGAVLDKPSLVTIIESAGRPPVMDAPLAGYESSSEHFDLRQRHLTIEEKQELSYLLKRNLRKLLLWAAALAWAATALANAVEQFVTSRPPHLNGSTVVLTAAFVIAVLGRRFAALRRIRRDLLGGIVIVLRPREDGLEEVTFERLPNSNVPWSEFGAPARWRI